MTKDSQPDNKRPELKKVKARYLLLKKDKTIIKTVKRNQQNKNI
ncbi:hypothetical protein [Clostridium ljungdahlii]